MSKHILNVLLSETKHTGNVPTSTSRTCFYTGGGMCFQFYLPLPNMYANLSPLLFQLFVSTLSVFEGMTGMIMIMGVCLPQTVAVVSCIILAVLLKLSPAWNVTGRVVLGYLSGVIGVTTRSLQ